MRSRVVQGFFRRWDMVFGQGQGLMGRLGVFYCVAHVF